VTTSVLLSNRFMAQDIENGHDIRVPTGRTAPKSVTRQPLQTVFNLCLIAIWANHSYRNYLNSWHSATQLEPTKLALDSSGPMVPMRQRYLGCSHCIRHQNKTPFFLDQSKTKPVLIEPCYHQLCFRMVEFRRCRS